MQADNPFRWRQFEVKPILLCLRWYLRYALSYRDLEEVMRERGLSVDHTTIYRWVRRYAPEIDKRCRPYLGRTNDSCRIDETYVRVGEALKYLYRGVDSNDETLDFFAPFQTRQAISDSVFPKDAGNISYDTTTGDERGTSSSRIIESSNAEQDRCWASKDSTRRGQPCGASR